MNKPNKELKERPILFSAPMVRAILEGRKTKTRRVVKTKPFKFGGVEPTQNFLFLKDGIAHFGFNDLITNKVKCPYGVGDRLWVRENFAFVGGGDPGLLLCQADWQETAKLHKCDNADKPPRWKPSIHMPRWASRITLEITDIRVERLQDIRQDGAKAEGATPKLPRILGDDYIFRDDYTGGFIDLWESINGKGSWGANPFVWVIGFERVTP